MRPRDRRTRVIQNKTKCKDSEKKSIEKEKIECGTNTQQNDSKNVVILKIRKQKSNLNQSHNGNRSTHHKTRGRVVKNVRRMSNNNNTHGDDDAEQARALSPNTTRQDSERETDDGEQRGTNHQPHTHTNQKKSHYRNLKYQHHQHEKK